MRTRFLVIAFTLSLLAVISASPAWAVCNPKIADDTTRVVCLGAADNHCSQLGATTMDGDRQNIIACLTSSPTATDCTGNQCQWKAMTMGTTAVPTPTGTLCGSVFWEVNTSAGCTNVQNRATCQGQPLMTTCGTVACPTGYTASQIGYSWGNNSGAYTYTYNQYTCVKS